MSQLPFNFLPPEPPEAQDSELVPVTRKKRQAQPPLSVTQAAAVIKQVLADSIPGKIRIVGEISNLSNRTHWFFSIKDQGAALRCVCFASNARRVKFPVRDGMQVIVTGRIDFFEGQGSLQVYVDSMEQVGQGSLEQQLQAMIAELRELGYLDVDRKKPMPAMCQRIAVVTSRSAAALQDVINTACRRWAGCELLHFDVRVQGDAAAPEIAKALRVLSDQGEKLGIDAIILTRGGGSIEDLWAFNERMVADAIFNCRLPIVAAIGHETDTTVAELVADMRCATPTQAAMTLVPDRKALDHQLMQMTGRLRMSLQRYSQFSTQRLQHAKERIAIALPGRITPAAARLEQAVLRLPRVAQRRLDNAQQQIKSLARTLEAVGPARVLERGYSYTTHADGKLLRSVKDVQTGQTICTVLGDGKVSSVVGDGGDRGGKQPVKRKIVRSKSKFGGTGEDASGLFGEMDV